MAIGFNSLQINAQLFDITLIKKSEKQHYETCMQSIIDSINENLHAEKPGLGVSESDRLS